MLLTQCMTYQTGKCGISFSVKSKFSQQILKTKPKQQHPPPHTHTNTHISTQSTTPVNKVRKQARKTSFIKGGSGKREHLSGEETDSKNNK